MPEFGKVVAGGFQFSSTDISPDCDFPRQREAMG
jgi:hypothetical protein